MESAIALFETTVCGWVEARWRQRIDTDRYGLLAWELKPLLEECCRLLGMSCPTHHLACRSLAVWFSAQHKRRTLDLRDGAGNAALRRAGDLEDGEDSADVRWAADPTPTWAQERDNPKLWRD